MSREGVSIEIEVSEDWAEVMTVPEQNGRARASTATREEEPHLAGTVSPAFRKTEWAPFLKLVGRRRDRPCVFRTTFLASARS